MLYSSQGMVLGSALVDSLLAALSARPAAALLSSPKIHLSKDVAFDPQSNSVPATLAANEAAFSGYTAGGYAVTFAGPVTTLGQQRALLVSQLFTRTVGTPDVGESVSGWWIDAGTVFVGGERFPNAFDLTDPSSYLDLLVSYPLPTAENLSL